MRYQVVMARRSRSKIWGFCGVTAWFALVALQAPSAQAVILSNNDSEAYKIEVIAKSVRAEHELAPGKSKAGFCKQGCIIRLNGSADNDYELEGSERVSIEGGLVYYDGEEVQKTKDGTQDQ